MTPGQLSKRIIVDRIKKWLALGSLIVAAIVFVLALPYAASAYHLEAGGRALDEALGAADSLTWWYIGPRETQNPQALQEAIAHLQKAHKASHAQRLLGRAYAAQGDPLRSIEALRQFAASRPDHPLGHLELAAAYELADRRLQETEYVDLLVTLPGAAVSAPDLDGQVSYRPEGWQSEYVYPTAFSLPPNYGERPTLFLHAGSWVTYTVALTQPSVLRFGMGLDPRSLGWGGDGATFEVFVGGKRVFLEHLPVEWAREGWQEREVDLAERAGQRVRLTLATTPGPKGDVAADWAGWGTPRIEAPEAAAYRQVVMGKPWLAEWRGNGITAWDFIQAGEEARKAKQYQEALTWYGWSMRLSPERGDAWYHIALVREDQGQWLQALDAYRRAAELGHLRYVHRSDPHYRSGMIYHWQLEPRQLDAALAAYKTAIEADDFSNDWVAADCHYRRAEILWGTGAAPDEYIAECRQAIERQPEHWPARLLLGVAYYIRYKDVAMAETEIQQALKLAPQNPWPFYYLGDIYRQEGNIDKAITLYEQALEVDPGFEVASKWLETIKVDR